MLDNGIFIFFIFAFLMQLQLINRSDKYVLVILYLANLRGAAVQGRVDIFPVVNWGEMKGLPGCVVVWQTMVSSPHDGLHNQVLARVLQWSIVSTCTISKGHYMLLRLCLFHSNVQI